MIYVMSTLGLVLAMAVGVIAWFVFGFLDVIAQHGRTTFFPMGCLGCVVCGMMFMMWWIGRVM